MDTEIQNIRDCNLCDSKGYIVLDMHGAVSLRMDLYTGKKIECMWCHGTGQMITKDA